MELASHNITYYVYRRALFNQRNRVHSTIIVIFAIFHFIKIVKY